MKSIYISLRHRAGTGAVPRVSELRREMEFSYTFSPRFPTVLLFLTRAKGMGNRLPSRSPSLERTTKYRIFERFRVLVITLLLCGQLRSHRYIHEFYIAIRKCTQLYGDGEAQWISDQEGVRNNCSNFQVLY